MVIFLCFVDYSFDYVGICNVEVIVCVIEYFVGLGYKYIVYFGGIDMMFVC